MVSDSRRPGNPGKWGGGYREGEARATRPSLSGDGMAADAAGIGRVHTFWHFTAACHWGWRGELELEAVGEV